ncbi:MAG: hypothetical protein WC042_02390 [Candidatus Paceibacterota bacterium]|jgi:hypothetical protein|nr:hypothetical protein [Candidatus Paceibacterota bacterium]MDD3548488.1 hypothetical protein [Candidatus Paceibacterota bacterium]MDD4999179.1 hypothetical protein [Candidatus Paceibacterota bacterium]MDD5545243.1 hypothetical protein [Candidatus Paceibacterota bacterium]
MYAPGGICSSILHVLLKHPILSVGLGIVLAVNFLLPLADKYEEAEIIDSSFELNQKINELENDPALAEALKKEIGPIKESEVNKMVLNHFLAIEKVETSQGLEIKETSFGFSKKALEYILEKIPCPLIRIDEIMSDPKEKSNFAFLYFLDLIYRFKSLDLAVMAFHFGPEKTQEAFENQAPLPSDFTNYLMKVKSAL